MRGDDRHHATICKPIDGMPWFPVYTYANILRFRGGPIRERLKIVYSAYKRCAESTFIVK